jgi:hypothetical protein
MADPNSLRQQLRELIERDSLSAAEQARLASPAKGKGHHRRLISIGAGLAASLFLVIMLWSAPGGNNIPPQNIQLRIAEEVTTNHTRVKPLDVTSSSIDVVQEHLPLLDFIVQRSSLFLSEGLELVGGRYCTLQGVIATQLVFRDRDGNRVTLYQAAYDRKRFGELPDKPNQQPVIINQRGTRVSLWTEFGVVFALATSSS